MVPELDYDAWLVNIMKGEQFTSGFVDVNPNSKIPTMLDNSDPSKPVRVLRQNMMLLHKAFVLCCLPRGSASIASRLARDAKRAWVVLCIWCPVVLPAWHVSRFL